MSCPPTPAFSTDQISVRTNVQNACAKYDVRISIINYSSRADFTGR